MAKKKKPPVSAVVHHALDRILMLFTPQPEGGFTITSPSLPELVTEGDTLVEAFANARDALAAVVELYADEGRPLNLSDSKVQK
jgi:antitoxin HicB